MSRPFDDPSPTLFSDVGGWFYSLSGTLTLSSRIFRGSFRQNKLAKNCTSLPDLSLYRRRRLEKTTELGVVWQTSKFPYFFRAFSFRLFSSFCDNFHKWRVLYLSSAIDFATNNFSRSMTFLAHFLNFSLFAAYRFPLDYTKSNKISSQMVCWWWFASFAPSNSSSWK